MTTHSHRRRSRRRPIAPRRRARSTRAAPLLDVRVEQRASVTVLHLSGEFDLCAVAPVERALDRAVRGPADRVVFDLRGLSFFDLSGLETLLRADARAHRESFAVAVVPPPGPAARIFAVTDAGRDLHMLDA